MSPDETMAADQTDDAFYSPPDEGKKVDESPPASVDEQEAENPTALIPLTALGGKAKVGDTVTIKVVKLFDEEAEVEISPAQTKPAKPSANDELDQMEEKPSGRM